MYQKFNLKVLVVLIALLGSLSLQAQKNDKPLIDLNSSSLSERWLIKNDSANSFKILPYKPVYVLLANYIDNINNLPQSDNPLNTVTTPTEFNSLELTFQLSFKSRVVRINKNKKFKIDLWVAYTQLSKWQFYNGLISRPFRETNYEKHRARHRTTFVYPGMSISTQLHC